MKWFQASVHVLSWNTHIICGSHKHYMMQEPLKQSGTKLNLVAKLLANKIGNLWAQATKIGSQH